jgi:hypothetical protein
MPSNNSANNNNNDNRNRLVVPQSQQAINQFKYEIASELGIPIRATGQGQDKSYEQSLDNYKWEVAQEIGIADQVRQRGWGEMSSRECGRVGGRMGGKIGGQMVRRLIQLAEQNLSGGQTPQ